MPEGLQSKYTCYSGHMWGEFHCHFSSCKKYLIFFILIHTGGKKWLSPQLQSLVVHTSISMESRTITVAQLILVELFLFDKRA